MRYIAAFWGCIILSLLFGEIAVHAAEKQTYSVGPINGTVVDTAGKPVAKAKVQLIECMRFVDCAVLEETTTDSKGHFLIEKRKYESRKGWAGLGIVVRDEQGRIGGISHVMARSADANSPQDVTVQLHDVKIYRGRLLDAAGKPIAKAQIKPMSWGGGDISGQNRQRFDLSAKLVRPAAALSGEDGSFSLSGLPAEGNVTTTVTAEGFGSPYVAFTLSKPVEIKLNKAGSIRGSIVTEKGDGEVGETKLFLTVSSDMARVRVGDCRVFYYKECTADKQGKFSYAAVPAGKYSIRPQLAGDSPYVTASTTPAFEVKAGEETVVSVPLKRALAVRGKVIDGKSGKGVEGVSLYFQDRNATGRSRWGKSVITDEKGEFLLYAKAAKLSVNIGNPPKGYIKPDQRQQSDPVEVSKDMTWPTIKLQPAAMLEGIVVDEAGKAVAGAEIRPFISSDHFSNRSNVKSDKDGKFKVQVGALKDPVSIRVRSDTATSDGPLVVVPAEAKGPTKIVVSSKKAFILKGTLVNEAGKPIPAAKVPLHTGWRTPGGGIGFRLSTTTTDEKGCFAFKNLWPGDEYHVVIEAAGYTKNQTARISGKAGQTHDFGKIVLGSAQAAIEGKVVDSAGKPLAGVLVFNAGDAPEPRTTHTDAKGHFRLDGLRSGSVYAFVKHEGYRFAGAKTKGGAKDVEIILLRKDEAPPKPPQSQLVSYEEQKQIAGKIIRRLWEVEDHKRLGTAIVVMARLDPEQALAWSKEIGGRYDSRIRAVVAEQVAESDIDEAIDLIGSDFSGFKRLAQQLVTTDPAKALRCTEEMAVHARNMDQPWRAINLAAAGRLTVRAGNKQAGRKMLEEAADMTDRMGSGQSFKRACGEVAKALAVVDPERAIKLIESGMEKNQQGHYMARIAAAAGENDLDSARKILKKIQPWYATRAVTPIAYHVARTRPDEALKFIEERFNSDQPYGSDRRGAKVQALCWVAVAIAPHDKERAWQLIDEGLDLCVGPHKGHYYSGIRNHQTIAALMAVQAKAVGYPDMPSVVHRVLASRETSKEGRSPMEMVESNVVMAMILALADPAAAREVLESIQSQSDRIGSGQSGIRREHWLRAWALADAEKLPELIEAELKAKKDNPKKEYNLYQLMSTLEILAMPPAERLKKITDHTSQIWVPGNENW